MGVVFPLPPPKGFGGNGKSSASFPRGIPRKFTENVARKIKNMKRKLSKEQWEQLKTAYASGLGLRELARNMGVAEGTVLARAKREGWTKQITEAKGLALKKQSNAITPMQSVVSTLQERGENYKDSMHLLIEKKVRQLLSSGLPDIENMSDAERFNKIARETYGLNSSETQINIQTNVLASLMEA